jgi:hypothetical protein
MKTKASSVHKITKTKTSPIHSDKTSRTMARGAVLVVAEVEATLNAVVMELELELLQQGCPWTAANSE